MFRKMFLMESANFFPKRWRDIKSLLQKYLCFGILLGGRYLFEILHTSSTVKNSKNVLKNGCF